MSNYSAFFSKDFAARCLDLLRHFYRPAVVRDREVTLLLAIAAAGLVVPYERLAGSSGQPLTDQKSYKAEARGLQQVLGETIGVSDLLKSNLRAWTGGLLADAEGDPERWPELPEKTPLGESRTVKYVVKCLRDALAHGNITTRGGQEIDSIVFVCGYKSGHPGSERHPLRYVAVAPDDLKRFLEQWFEKLPSLHVTRQELADVLNEPTPDKAD